MEKKQEILLTIDGIINIFLGVLVIGIVELVAKSWRYQ